MSDRAPAPIATIEEFYAHALAIEREAAERYAEFAKYFEDRDEPSLAGLCRNLSALEREHHDELARGCTHLDLPAIARGDYRWLEAESPEAPAREAFYRIATPRHLLEIALNAELRARDFFVNVALHAPHHAVRDLAGIMAAEELEHVAWVQRALEYHSMSGMDWDDMLKAGIAPGSFTNG